MPKSNLPVPKQDSRSVKIGNIIIKLEKPSESASSFKNSLEVLEKAAKNRAFNQDARFQT